jgi:hypothetical protein
MAQTKITGNNISNATQALINALRFNSSSSLLSLPFGTTAQRPTGISLGTVRFNTTKDSAEIYNNQTGTADWNGIGSETGVDGGNLFVRTNGTTITKNITIGPTANGDQKYTHGLLIGDITIDSGFTVTIEEGSILAIHDDQDNGFIPDLAGSGAAGSWTNSQFLKQHSYTNYNRLSTSSSSNVTIDSFKFTKKSSTSILVIEAAISARGNDNDGNYYFVDINGTKNYTGFGESPYSEYYGIYVTQVWTGLSSGEYTLSWGWFPIDGSSNRPFNLTNVNSNDDGRNRQNGSEWMVFEVEPGFSGVAPSIEPTTDSNYYSTTLLLNFNDNIIDNSNYAHDIISAGSFGYSNIPSSPVTGGLKVGNFVGTSGYTSLQIPDSIGLKFGTGDFTIEGWIYINSNDSGLSGYNRRVFQKGANSTSGYALFYDSSNVYFGRTDEQILTNPRSNWNSGWRHFAIVRDNGVFRMYRDGTQVSSSSSGASTALDVDAPLYLGVYPADPTAAASNHYLDEFRITKGVCRYPNGTTFTPSTNPFPTRGTNILGSSLSPATSARALVTAGYTQDGVYWIQASSSAPKQRVYCILNSAYDGGGWMIVSNCPASTYIPNAGHYPRVTSYPSFVGSNTFNSFTPNSYFSVNCQDIAFTKLYHVIMSDAVNYDLANKTIGYVGHVFNSAVTIPTTKYWAFDNTGTSMTRGSVVTWPGFGNKRARYSGNVQSGGSGLWGLGVVPTGANNGSARNNGGEYASAPGSTNKYFSYGSGVVYTPPYLEWYDFSGYLVSAFGFTDAYGTTPGSAQQAFGFDDWQDGSGMSDVWDCENTSQGTARGKPSFVMIK